MKLMAVEGDFYGEDLWMTQANDAQEIVDAVSMKFYEFSDQIYSAMFKKALTFFSIK